MLMLCHAKVKYIFPNLIRHLDEIQLDCVNRVDDFECNEFYCMSNPHVRNVIPVVSYFVLRFLKRSLQRETSYVRATK